MPQRESVRTKRVDGSGLPGSFLELSSDGGLLDGFSAWDCRQFILSYLRSSLVGGVPRFGVVSEIFRLRGHMFSSLDLEPRYRDSNGFLLPAGLELVWEERSSFDTMIDICNKASEEYALMMLDTSAYNAAVAVKKLSIESSGEAGLQRVVEMLSALGYNLHEALGRREASNLDKEKSRVRLISDSIPPLVPQFNNDGEVIGENTAN